MQADLLHPAAVRRALSGLGDVTHLFFAAYQEGENPDAQVSLNLAMLKNAIEAIESAAPQLERIVLMEGVKAYGVHLGPFKTPAKESDPAIQANTVHCERPAQRIWDNVLAA